MRIAALFTLALSLLVAACGILPDGRNDRSTRMGSAPATAPSPSPEARQCLADLGRSGAHFRPLPGTLHAGGCSTKNTVRLDRISGDNGKFELTNLSVIACPLANSFAAWARYGVDRAARQILGAGLARIETMGSYSCRNVAGTRRLSAHARAEAVDIAGFVLTNGQRITIKDGWNAGSRERAFLRAVHKSACKRFGTVLGPDYNPAHRDHLHLEFGSGHYCR